MESIGLLMIGVLVISVLSLILAGALVGKSSPSTDIDTRQSNVRDERELAETTKLAVQKTIETSIADASKRLGNAIREEQSRVANEITEASFDKLSKHLEAVLRDERKTVNASVDGLSKHLEAVLRDERKTVNASVDGLSKHLENVIRDERAVIVETLERASDKEISLDQVNAKRLETRVVEAIEGIDVKSLEKKIASSLGDNASGKVVNAIVERSNDAWAKRLDALQKITEATNKRIANDLSELATLTKRERETARDDKETMARAIGDTMREIVTASNDELVKRIVAARDSGKASEDSIRRIIVSNNDALVERVAKNCRTDTDETSLRKIIDTAVKDLTKRIDEKNASSITRENIETSIDDLGKRLVKHVNETNADTIVKVGNQMASSVREERETIAGHLENIVNAKTDTANRKLDAIESLLNKRDGIDARDLAKRLDRGNAKLRELHEIVKRSAELLNDDNAKRNNVKEAIESNAKRLQEKIDRLPEVEAIVRSNAKLLADGSAKLESIGTSIGDSEKTIREAVKLANVRDIVEENRASLRKINEVAHSIPEHVTRESSNTRDILTAIREETNERSASDLSSVAKMHEATRDAATKGQELALSRIAKLHEETRSSIKDGQIAALDKVHVSMNEIHDNAFEKLKDPFADKLRDMMNERRDSDAKTAELIEGAQKRLEETLRKTISETGETLKRDHSLLEERVKSAIKESENHAWKRAKRLRDRDNDGMQLRLSRAKRAVNADASRPLFATTEEPTYNYSEPFDVHRFLEMCERGNVARFLAASMSSANKSTAESSKWIGIASDQLLKYNLWLKDQGFHVKYNSFYIRLCANALTLTSYLLLASSNDDVNDVMIERVATATLLALPDPTRYLGVDVSHDPVLRVDALGAWLLSRNATDTIDTVPDNESYRRALDLVNLKKHASHGCGLRRDMTYVPFENAKNERDIDIRWPCKLLEPARRFVLIMDANIDETSVIAKMQELRATIEHPAIVESLPGTLSVTPITLETERLNSSAPVKDGYEYRGIRVIPNARFLRYYEPEFKFEIRALVPNASVYPTPVFREQFVYVYHASMQLRKLVRSNDVLSWPFTGLATYEHLLKYDISTPLLIKNENHELSVISRDAISAVMRYKNYGIVYQEATVDDLQQYKIRELIVVDTTKRAVTITVTLTNLSKRMPLHYFGAKVDKSRIVAPEKSRSFETRLYVNEKNEEASVTRELTENEIKKFTLPLNINGDGVMLERDSDNRRFVLTVSGKPVVVSFDDEKDASESIVDKGMMLTVNFDNSTNQYITRNFN